MIGSIVDHETLDMSTKKETHLSDQLMYKLIPPDRCLSSVQRSEDKQQAGALASSMSQIEDIMQSLVSDDKTPTSKRIASSEGAQGSDGQIAHSLLTASFSQLSTKAKISAEEAAVALDYIDHVKELRDQVADLEKDSEENRQACNSAKVLWIHGY